MPQALNEIDDVAEATPLLGAPAPVAEAAPKAELPVLVLRPTSGWRALNVRELWRFRELLFFLAWRDVAVRYKQTVLGAAWAVIQPFMTMVVFSVFFGKLGGMAKNVDLPYPIFVYAALLPWQFFAGALAQGGTSLIHSERLIGKVYFPRLLIPFANIGAGLVDFGVSMLVMFGLMAWYQVFPTLNVLILPLPTLGLLAAALGAGTLLASLSVVYRDFRYVIPFLVQIWMFVSPVAYPLDVVPESWRLVYSLNPLAGVIAGYRAALLGTAVPWDCLAISLVSSAALFVLGTCYFKSVEKRFADVV